MGQSKNKSVLSDYVRTNLTRYELTALLFNLYVTRFKIHNGHFYVGKESWGAPYEPRTKELNDFFEKHAREYPPYNPDDRIEKLKELVGKRVFVSKPLTNKVHIAKIVSSNIKGLVVQFEEAPSYEFRYVKDTDVFGIVPEEPKPKRKGLLKILFWDW